MRDNIGHERGMYSTGGTHPSVSASGGMSQSDSRRRDDVRSSRTAGVRRRADDHRDERRSETARARPSDRTIVALPRTRSTDHSQDDLVEIWHISAYVTHPSTRTEKELDGQIGEVVTKSVICKPFDLTHSQNL